MLLCFCAWAGVLGWGNHPPASILLRPAVLPGGFEDLDSVGLARPLSGCSPSPGKGNLGLSRHFGVSWWVTWGAVCRYREEVECVNDHKAEDTVLLGTVEISLDRLNGEVWMGIYEKNKRSTSTRWGIEQREDGGTEGEPNRT